MAWAPDYATLAQLKAQLRVTDTDDDTALGAAIKAASRAVDKECLRQFGSATQTRYYSPDCHMMINGRAAIRIDDIQTNAALTVASDTAYDGLYATSWTIGTDFTLWPPNAPSDGLPWTHLLLANRSAKYFPLTPDSVKVTGTFGWTAVPDVVLTATLIQAARFFTRRDSAYGVAGSPEIGNMVRLLARLDPDVALLLSSVKRYD